MKYLLIILTGLMMLSFGKKENEMSSYIIEVTTFKINPSTNTEDFWKEDSKVDAIYTSKQPGYISRESAFNDNTNEVLVIAKWKSIQDAEASMAKFMTDASVSNYVSMIDGVSMKMTRYQLH